jgi:hypothetical protein
MTEQQIEGNPNKWFAIIEHIADEELNPYQYRLYGHYRRVIGEVPGNTCWESTRTTAKNTQMSVGKVSSTRLELEDMGYITIADGEKDTLVIRIVDQMPRNIKYFQDKKDSVHDVNKDVHEVNGNVHGVKQRRTRTKKNLEKKTTTAAAEPLPDFSEEWDSLVKELRRDYMVVGKLAAQCIAAQINAGNEPKHARAAMEKHVREFDARKRDGPALLVYALKIEPEEAVNIWKQSNRHRQPASAGQVERPQITEAEREEQRKYEQRRRELAQKEMQS